MMEQYLIIINLSKMYWIIWSSTSIFEHEHLAYFQVLSKSISSTTDSYFKNYARFELKKPGHFC